MKLIAFIFIMGFLMSGLQGNSQSVTIAVKDAKLESVLKQFKRQTGRSFFVDEPTLKKAVTVTLDIKNVPLEDALAACFANQPNLSYSIVGRTVVISEKPKANNQEFGPVDQEGLQASVVKGYVTNKRFETLANASVSIRGVLKGGTTTDADGAFTLKGVKKGDVLQISYIGYQTKEIILTGNSALTIVLENANDELDHVVAQGYSKTTKRLSTSSVAKVTAEEMERQPVMNPLMVLQGKVPGLVLTPSTGYSAGPVEINIRGKGLLSRTSVNPLIIIDGTPLNVSSNDGTQNGDGPVQGVLAMVSPVRSQSMLFGLNPKDIESIEILKDMGATAIYGSSGANGVILITTKRGKAGSSDISVNVNYGLSKITRYWNMLNTTQYLEMRREAFKNDGIAPNVNNAPDLFLWDTTRYTDWQRELYGGTGGVLNASVGYTAGTPLINYRIAANYSRIDEIGSSGNNKTMGFSFSLDRKSENRKFITALSIQYNHSFVNVIRTPGLADLPPNAPPAFDSAGNLNFKGWSNSVMYVKFIPFGLLLMPTESRTNFLQANLRLSYQLAKGLLLSTSLSRSQSNSDGMNLVPITAQDPLWAPTGMAYFTKGETGSVNIEPQLSYDSWLFGKGKIGVIAGATIKREERQSVSDIAGGYSNDAMLRSLGQAAFVSSSNQRSLYNYAGVMGRVEYVWDNKYVVNGIWRRDGSSRFGPGSRFGNFGSAGIAWIASDENWYKKSISPVVSFLKFYANIGTTGNDGGADYQYLSQWSRDGLLNYDGIVPIRSIHAENQQYHWQSGRELNLGSDMRFMKSGNLGLSVNYYRRRVGNQLTNNPTPIISGFPSVYSNWDATVQNEGLEFTINATIINGKNFRWYGSVNAGFNKNVLLSYSGLESSPDYSNLLVGQSTYIQYVLNYLGVDPLTGSYQFEDYNKDGVINTTYTRPLSPTTDMKKIIEGLPKLAGGINQGFSYKNVSLNLTFDFIVQKGVNAFVNVSTPGQTGNIPVEIFNNRWQKPGDNSRYAKFTTQNYQGFSIGQTSMGLADASFLRLNNLSFSYILPEKLLKKLAMKNAAFNINTRNLFVITGYDGIDPEIRDFSGMPPSRTITAGFSLTF